MCLGDFVSGLPPLPLFHFLARRPLPARLIAKSLCPCSNRALKHDPDPAITGHVRGRRKHKLGAERAAEGASVRQVVPFKSARHGGGTPPAAPSQSTPAPRCPPGGRRCEQPA